MNQDFLYHFIDSIQNYAVKHNYSKICTFHLLHIFAISKYAHKFVPQTTLDKITEHTTGILEVEQKPYIILDSKENKGEPIISNKACYLILDSYKRALSNNESWGFQHLVETLEPIIDILLSSNSHNQESRSKIQNIINDFEFRQSNKPIYLSQLIKALHASQELTHNTEEYSNEKEKTEDERILKDFTDNMVDWAKCGLYSPVIAREKEIHRIWQILLRYKKGNPIIVGDAGVGKTAVVEGIAQQIANKTAPKVFHDCNLFSLNLTKLISGTKYRGELEKRFNKIVDELIEMKKVIVFIDEIHTIVGFGQAGESALDISNLLKPILTDSSIRIIGCTTSTEYDKFLEKDSALIRRFSKVYIDEPNLEDGLKMIENSIDDYETFHGVSFDKSALKTAVTQTHKLIFDRKLPDKAIDIIDESAALHRLNQFQKRNINSKDIEKTIAKVTNIPQSYIDSNEKQQLKTLEPTLKKYIFGQDQAIKSIVESLILRKSNCSDPSKPLSSMLFVGPTGVGKTELCNQLAKHLNIPIHRFDMSEYMERHSISRLIGAPPGYIGYGEKGQLVTVIEKNPHSLILFDEVEKAHPDVINILLQILDYGVFRHAKGNQYNFRESLIIMTSNIGSSDIANYQNLGFIENKNAVSEKITDSVKGFFRIELLNRIDRVVHFNQLEKKLIERIIDKYLQELSKRLQTKNIRFKVSKSVIRWIAANGYSSELGARPIYRFIQQHIALPIAQHLIFSQRNNQPLTFNFSLDKKEQIICVPEVVVKSQEPVLN